MLQSSKNPREKAALEAGLEKLYKYYDKQCVVASLSCILDPTKNLRFLKTVKWEEKWINDAKFQLRQAYDSYKGQPTGEGPKTLTADLYPGLSEIMIAADDEHEIDRYFAYPLLPQGTDILGWWKCTGKMTFPTLAKVAKDYLAIPASSVASERVFSQAADICTSDRNRLDPDTVSDAMCLKMWLQRTHLFQ
jgi:hypothetical protein